MYVLRGAASNVSATSHFCLLTLRIHRLERSPRAPLPEALRIASAQSSPMQTHARHELTEGSGTSTWNREGDGCISFQVVALPLLFYYQLYPRLVFVLLTVIFQRTHTVVTWHCPPTNPADTTLACIARQDLEDSILNSTVTQQPPSSKCRS